MFGTALLAAGLAGFACKALHSFLKAREEREKFHATVAKTRLDTKKADGAEFYTYILTFFIPQKNDYISFEVTQKQFDVTIEKDSGILICNFEKEKFFSWKASESP